MTLKELQPQLLALSLEEKAQAIQILAASLSNRGWAEIATILEIEAENAYPTRVW